MVDPSRYLYHFRFICLLKADKIAIMPKPKAQTRESKKGKGENRSKDTGENLRRLNKKKEKEKKEVEQHGKLSPKTLRVPAKGKHQEVSAWFSDANHEDVYFIFSGSLLGT